MKTTPKADFFSVIHNRKSVRQYSDAAIATEEIETMLKAAMASPSARNVQPWLFYVIRKREILDALAEGLPYAKMLTQAPLAIVVSGDTALGNPNEEQVQNWALDCASATQNLLLAAEALGLGAVWTGVYPYKQRIEVIRHTLTLPSHIIPLCIIPIGYPLKEEKAKDKWNPDKIQWID